MSEPSIYSKAIPKPGLRNRKGAPKGSKIPEAVIQEQAEAYLNTIGIDFFHLPAQTLNAAFHMRPMSGGEQWAARNASAAIKGFPDLILFYKGFYKAVELKSRDGVVSQWQEKWRKKLSGSVFYSFEDFRNDADEWITRCDLISKIYEETRQNKPKDTP